MKTKHLHGRVLAVAAAAAVGLTGLSSAAFADDAAGAAAASALAVGNIQPNTKGSLIIHKHEDGTQNPQGTPDGKTQVTAKGVEGVEFTAFPITNLDLTKQEDWNGLADVKVPAGACGDNVTPVPFQVNGKMVTFAAAGVKTTKATDANGEAKIENLPVAAYLVCETLAPSNVVQPAEPFLVTIPFPNNEKNVGKDKSFDKNWLYDVNVYPKNKLADKPKKDLVVSNNGLVNDGQLTYTVSQTVPAIAADHSFSEFIIGDKMSAGQDAEVGNVASVKVGDVDLAGKYKVEKKGDKLYVGLTKEGLAAIKGHQGKSVVVTFKTKANQIGQLTNEAETYVKTIPGDNPPDTPPTTPPDTPPNTPPTPPQPTNKVFSSWGDLVVAKQDKDNSKKLAGATFEVYNAAKAYDGTCTKEIDGAALTVNGKATFTTDATGTVKIDGLFVSQGSANQKLVDGKPQFEADGVTPIYDDPEWPNGNTHRCYVLKETAAPAGYTLPAGDDALFPVKVTPGATTAPQDIVIDNTKQDVPKLPLTGANGELLLTIGGASLVLLALGATLVARRRNEQI